MFDIGKLLRLAVEKGASDIHLIVGQPPVLRKSGQLIMGWDESVTAEDMDEIMEVILPPRIRTLFEQTNEADFPIYFDEHGLTAEVRDVAGGSLH